MCSIVDFVNISDTNLWVKDVWKEGAWRLNELFTILPSELRNKIETYPISLTDHVEDCFIWGAQGSGVYEARSVYTWLLHKNRQLDFSVDWKWVWKIPAPEKCRFLVWLMCHDALPTNELRFSRGLASNPLCQRCHRVPETVLH